MKKFNKLRQGFTLIELLIVVSIIGILSVALIPNISGAPARARDAARKAMLSEVASAIETFNIDKGIYPAGDACITHEGEGDDPDRGADLDEVVTIYMNGNPPTQNPVTGLGDAGDVDPECDDSVHYTKLSKGYLLFVPLEANRGGDYDIEDLEDRGIGDDAATVISEDAVDESGTGNAHALIR